jgi:hypothetical protein
MTETIYNLAIIALAVYLGVTQGPFWVGLLILTTYGLVGTGLCLGVALLLLVMVSLHFIDGRRR